MPTLLGYLGLGEQLRALRPISPGHDFSSVLRGRTISWDNVVYYEMQHTRAIRTEQWKYVHRPQGPYELYDLKADPYEKFNMYGQPTQAAIQQELKNRLERFFAATAEPKYDLYRGGTSKATLLAEGVKPGEPRP